MTHRNDARTKCMTKVASYTLQITLSESGLLFLLALAKI